jgi:thiamine pyrophosphokinase
MASADDPDRIRDVVVLAGGDPVDPRTVARIPRDALVIAADAGLHATEALRIDADVVVGDLDSVDARSLDDAIRKGAQVERYPVDKDRTDLAIALDLATRRGAERITVVGGYGGRLDHLAANLALLASPDYTATIVALMGPATVTVVRDSSELSGRPGELVSLLPAHGPALGVSTAGLRFPLEDEDLSAGSSRGVSNELVSPRAHVQVREGCLLAIQPGELA